MILTHEGYTAEVGYEDGDALMHGTVSNTRAVLHFAGRTIDELKQAFADTIADYRAWCEERGVAPEKPYSGTLSLRIPQELHRRLAEKAAKAGSSLNQFIVEQLAPMSIKRMPGEKAPLRLAAAKRKPRPMKTPRPGAVGKKRAERGER